MFSKKKGKEDGKKPVAKDARKKSKADAPQAPVAASNGVPGYVWPPNGFVRDQMSEAIYVQKPNSVISEPTLTSAPKYGAHNLQLVTKETKKDAKKDKKKEKENKKDKQKDAKKEGKKAKDKKVVPEAKAGILKSAKKDSVGSNGHPGAIYAPHASQPVQQQPGGQVTFAGPDNRVHQSVVKISQTSNAQLPDILPNNYQTNMPNPAPGNYQTNMHNSATPQVNGYLAPMMQSQMTTTPSQQQQMMSAYGQQATSQAQMMTAQQMQMTSPMIQQQMTSAMMQQQMTSPQPSQAHMTQQGSMPSQQMLMQQQQQQQMALMNHQQHTHAQQTNAQPQNGQMYSANQYAMAANVSAPVMQVPQQFAGNAHQTVRQRNSDPSGLRNAEENVKHLKISQPGISPRHVTSIDMIGKPNQPNYVRSRSPSPASGIAMAHGGLPHDNAYAANSHNMTSVNGAYHARPAHHGKGLAPGPPVVVAEVNVPQSMIAPKQRDAYARFNEILEKVHDDHDYSDDTDPYDDDVVQYAELSHQRPVAAAPPRRRRVNDIQREKIANLTVEMDSDSDNEHPLRIKGILKQPKRVEFNKDVDVTLFGTLSRHESLESIYKDRSRRGGLMAAKQRQRRAPAQQAPAPHRPPPPSYASVVEERPLDDTDLYMYTMRRRRPPTVYVARDGYSRTLRSASRHGSLRAAGSRSRDHVQTVRVIPGSRFY